MVAEIGFLIESCASAGFKAFAADALYRQPGEIVQPDDSDIRDFGSGLSAMKDPDVFSTVED